MHGAASVRMELSDDLERMAWEICPSLKFDCLSGVPTTGKMLLLVPRIGSEFIRESTGCCTSVHMDDCLPTDLYGTHCRQQIHNNMDSQRTAQPSPKFC